ncbi:MAG TPA: iron chelate uptake ABC transporter family permease subunit [Planctomycetota bacterium]|jgi:zinc/manganese transport system permease protein|nr:metal ABC transporter permease [Planctomycetota bacterium]OQC21446.1 MAG: high-affinity zinc transporter membrane component [Planctomycetes bacterium ADurb.Bin069]HNR97795.1 iron chelate uptake ABC transporter family permease subunit [Planctomycetota bacterium]HNU24738.1 iron chelate uptake ABC transporter family permease subunit [Planctomycetota bacterium]HOE29940.1 iron chelate uptake ABC transporter family permease subunit [Planctomycetota bacterium]
MPELIDLLGLPLAACLLALSILSCVGVHVLKREIVFIDIALAQIVAVGAVWAHVYFDAGENSLLHHASTLGCALGAAVFYSVCRRRIAQVPLEAVIGVSYAIAAAGALFLLGIGARGHVHVQHMLSGNILWTRWEDLAFSAAVFAAAGALFFLLRPSFDAISEGYEAARRRGVKVVWWDFLFYTLVGLVITRAVCMCGVVLVFAFLIIPAAIAALFAAGWVPRLAIAWSVGALASLLGLLFAARLDFSLGPSVALFLGICLILAAVLRRRRRSVSMAVLAAAAGAYVALLAAYPGELGPVRSQRAAAETCAPDAEAAEEPAASFSETEIRRRLEAAGAPAEFEALFGLVDDPALRAAIVCKALEADAPTGAALALRFLRSDPPFFFGQQAADGLRGVMGGGLEYDATRPAADPANRRALAAVREKYNLED